MKTMKNMERLSLKNILGIINPTDEQIFLRGVGIPPTMDDFLEVLTVRSC
jgi:hypothetical protein